MGRVLSTYRFVGEPLKPNLLAEIAQAGIPKVEIFCAQSHFNYHSPKLVRELQDWLAEHRLEIHALHAPTERDFAPARESAVPMSISDPERVRRLDAVDEVKRVLEVAERIPFGILVLHLTHGRQSHDPRKLDAAFNSLEHLVVFAKQRGVTIALENTPGELSSPSSLMHFIKDTHLNDLRLCFDLGHAHIEDGIEPSFEIMRDRIITTHVHDNHGERDEHLPPGDGSIDWEAALQTLGSAPGELPLVLELKELSSGKPALEDIRSAFDKLEQAMAARGASAASD